MPHDTAHASPLALRDCRPMAVEPHSRVSESDTRSGIAVVARKRNQLATGPCVAAPPGVPGRRDVSNASPFMTWRGGSAARAGVRRRKESPHD